MSVFYVYISDDQMGPGSIKICTYFPYPVKAWVHGHEWAKWQAAAAGIGFTALSNGFASADDPAALQGKASCDLSRLARNGLIARVPGRNRYTLTRDGLLFACFCTKVYDHILRPLMAPDRPSAPPGLAAALDTLDQLAAGHIANARVPHSSLTNRYGSHTVSRPGFQHACLPPERHHLL